MPGSFPLSTDRDICLRCQDPRHGEKGHGPHSPKTSNHKFDSSGKPHPRASITRTCLTACGVVGCTCVGFIEQRCTLCHSQRLTDGVCSFLECPDPFHDSRAEVKRGIRCWAPAPPGTPLTDQEAGVIRRMLENRK